MSNQTSSKEAEEESLVARDHHPEDRLANHLQSKFFFLFPLDQKCWLITINHDRSIDRRLIIAETKKKKK